MYFIALIIHLQSKRITCIFTSTIKRTRIFVHRISAFFSLIVFFLYISLGRMTSPEEITEWILRHIKENREKNARCILEIENRQKRIRFIYEFINQKMFVSILFYLCDRSLLFLLREYVKVLVKCMLVKWRFLLMLSFCV